MIRREKGIIEEVFVVPYSIAILAEIAIEESEWRLAESYLQRVKAHKGYDWERILAYRLYADQQRLERKTAGVVTSRK